MKVNHKTFSGGYKFSNFEGQPLGSVVSFSPEGYVADLTVKSGGGVSASEVLDALELTAFRGPESAVFLGEGSIKASKVTNILVSAVEVEPYDLPTDVVVNDGNITLFVESLKKIRESYTQAHFTLVVGEDQEVLQRLLFPIADNLSWLDTCTIDSKYPANLPAIQIPAVLGKLYPVGYSPACIGTLFLGVKDVMAVNDSSKVLVALSGTGWKENLVIQVSVGTSVKDITSRYLGDEEARLIKNSVVTGDVLSEEAVITYDLNVLIALPEDRRRQTLFFFRAGAKADSFSSAFLSSLLPKAQKTAESNLHGERRACVSCTYCQSVCPVGLIPHLLHKHVDKDIINERLAEYRIFDCVECGLCDYVCPSKIDVSSNIKRGKKKLENIGISHNKYVIPKVDMILEPEEVAADE